MTDWPKILRAISPRGEPDIIAGAALHMPAAIARADLSTPLRVAHFLAQLAHESDGFRTTREYASGAAYEGRKDLGNTQPGDGKRFRGRGLIQLTGRANYRLYGERLGLDLVAQPALAEAFPAALLVAAEYWRQRACNRPADLDDIRGVTKIINGGYNGIESRAEYLIRARRALANGVPVAPAPSTPTLPQSQPAPAAVPANGFWRRFVDAFTKNISV